MAVPLIWVTLSVSPSTSASLPRTASVTAVSSAVVKLSSLATGASLTRVTAIVVVETAEVSSPSLTVTFTTRAVVTGLSPAVAKPIARIAAL